jgi:hypothetical protein
LQHKILAVTRNISAGMQAEETQLTERQQKGSPRSDNNFCRAGAAETHEKAANANAVPIPEYDPITEKNGVWL